MSIESRTGSLPMCSGDVCDVLEDMLACDNPIQFTHCFPTVIYLVKHMLAFCLR